MNNTDLIYLIKHFMHNELKAVEEVIDAGIERIIFITGRTKKALEDHFDVNVELNSQLELSGKKDILKDMKYDMA